MIKEFFRSLRILLILSIIIGVVYPFFITGLAQFFFPFQANGSIIKREGKAIGSALIGQQFTGSGYFNGRPSAVDYNAASSGASNWGPTNKKLMDAVKERVTSLYRENPMETMKTIPADLVLASASGLDPHISPEAAMFQTGRISAARKIPKTQVIELIRKQQERPQFGFLGVTRVNVLNLNLALDALEKKHEQ
ncbi:MAG: potassium-transporting ATPase subunit KdpC [Candidatus Omnitrophica bacterium]|nr:potassium-transporting ATPase subunit KdpC [Candidatus Omnitrophota bacterium]